MGDLKDPSTYGIITYLWVTALASWGGLVSFLRKRREGQARPWNVMELMGELFTSAFVGIITFWLCEAADIHPLVTPALVGICGHMGSRALFHFEKWAEARFPFRGAKP